MRTSSRSTHADGKQKGAKVLGVLATTLLAGCAAFAQTSDRMAAAYGEVVVVKSLDDLEKMIREKKVAAVVFMTYDGRVGELDPARLAGKEQPSRFPEESSKIHAPRDVLFVPYTRNPSCVLVRLGYQWTTRCQ